MDSLSIRFVLSRRFRTPSHTIAQSNLEVGMPRRPRLPLGGDPSRVVLARRFTQPLAVALEG
jgi:hypothetical protein